MGGMADLHTDTIPAKAGASVDETSIQKARDLPVLTPVSVLNVPGLKLQMLPFRAKRRTFASQPTTDTMPLRCHN